MFGNIARRCRCVRFGRRIALPSPTAPSPSPPPAPHARCRRPRRCGAGDAQRRGRHAAVKNKNYALAVANFKALAEGGDAEAQRLYGQLLMVKCTGIQDEAAGAAWLQKAADGGDAIAAGPARPSLYERRRCGAGRQQGLRPSDQIGRWRARPGASQSGLSLSQRPRRAQGSLSGHGLVGESRRAGLPSGAVQHCPRLFQGRCLPQDNDKAAFYIQLAMQRSTPEQRARFVATIQQHHPGDERRTISSGPATRRGAGRRARAASAMSWTMPPGCGKSTARN